MSLRLLLDEDSQAKYLLNLLRLAGHDVITVNEAGLEGQVDSEVLNYAIQDRRSLLTRNCNDFRELHEINPNHSGVLAVYQDADLAKNMSYQAIAPVINLDG
ncbi:DUF5615 family PIN-like protein [Leptolyngbyaceae cyanobacterium UHCC 1019]